MLKKAQQLKSTDIETIAAIATPQGKGGVGIVRVSGPLALSIATSITGKVPRPRMAEYASFVDQAGVCVDKGLVLFFASPNSFTGEDVLELQGHGGPVVLNEVLGQALAHGARMAEPGEFSLRAFLNNKIDLVQAEAIAQLIDAKSHQAAHAAINSLDGAFSEKIADLVSRLVNLRTYTEAAIDFPEEEIDFLSDGKVIDLATSLLQEIDLTLQLAVQGEILFEGTNVAIVGKPNAGKSSLLNALAKQDLSIVTDIPGTTRDVVKTQITIDGLSFNVADTAGLNQSDNVVEQEGVRRALEQLKKANLVVCVIDGTTQKESDPFKLFPEWTDVLSEKTKIIVVINKIDKTKKSADVRRSSKYKEVFLSAKTGAGIELLQQELKKAAGFVEQQEGIFSARKRHVEALRLAKKHAANGFEKLRREASGEIFAEDLRYAQKALSTITGEFRADDLLGKIFSEFCIGK